MIVAARSRFSGYRFDDGADGCLRCLIVSGWGAASVHLVSCGSSRVVRVSFALVL